MAIDDLGAYICRVALHLLSRKHRPRRIMGGSHSSPMDQAEGLTGPMPVIRETSDMDQAPPSSSSSPAQEFDLGKQVQRMWRGSLVAVGLAGLAKGRADDPDYEVCNIGSLLP